LGCSDRIVKCALGAEGDGKLNCVMFSCLEIPSARNIAHGERCGSIGSNIVKSSGAVQNHLWVRVGRYG